MSDEKYNQFLRKLNSEEMQNVIYLLKSWREGYEAVERQADEKFSVEKANNNQFVMLFKAHFNSLSNEQKKLIRHAIRGVN